MAANFSSNSAFESETSTRGGNKAAAAANGGAGFMHVRNSHNRGLAQQKQMSAGVLTPLTNNASVGAINDYVSRAPPLGPDPGSLYGSRENAPGNYSNMNLRQQNMPATGSN